MLLCNETEFYRQGKNHYLEQCIRKAYFAECLNTEHLLSLLSILGEEFFFSLLSAFCSFKVDKSKCCSTPFHRCYFILAGYLILVLHYLKVCVNV